MNSESTSALFFAIYICIWSCGIINHFVFKKFFKARYQKEFTEHFQPMLERSIASGLREQKYIWERGYSVIDDQEFVKRCDIHRMISIISFIGVALGLVVASILIQQHQKPA